METVREGASLASPGMVVHVVHKIHPDHSSQARWMGHSLYRAQTLRLESMGFRMPTIGGGTRFTSTEQQPGTAGCCLAILVRKDKQYQDLDVAAGTAGPSASSISRPRVEAEAGCWPDAKQTTSQNRGETASGAQDHCKQELIPKSLVSMRSTLSSWLWNVLPEQSPPLSPALL